MMMAIMTFLVFLRSRLFGFILNLLLIFSRVVFCSFLIYVILILRLLAVGHLWLVVNCGYFEVSMPDFLLFTSQSFLLFLSMPFWFQLSLIFLASLLSVFLVYLIFETPLH